MTFDSMFAVFIVSLLDPILIAVLIASCLSRRWIVPLAASAFGAAVEEVVYASLHVTQYPIAAHAAQTALRFVILAYVFFGLGVAFRGPPVKKAGA